ncbi:MAG: hypothetical protein ACTS41_00390 [Candidatus Hodgkinia cicadicola]
MVRHITEVRRSSVFLWSVKLTLQHIPKVTYFGGALTINLTVN